MRKLIARSIATYAFLAPSHRGKHWLLRSTSAVLGPLNLPTPEGIELPVLLGSAMDLAYLRSSGPDEKGTVRGALSTLRPGDTFVDIGANLGYYSILAGRRVGRAGKVFSIEPSPREYVRLLRALSRNGVSDRCIPLNVAMSHCGGVVSLGVDPYHTGLNRVLPSENSQEGSCLVASCSGDELLLPLVPDVGEIGIKVDVEGHEYAVLSGMKGLLTTGRVRFVVVEITRKFLERSGSSKNQLLGLMGDLGFRPTVSSSEWQYDEVFVPASMHEVSEPGASKC